MHIKNERGGDFSNSPLVCYLNDEKFSEMGLLQRLDHVSPLDLSVSLYNIGFLSFGMPRVAIKVNIVIVVLFRALTRIVKWSHKRRKPNALKLPLCAGSGKILSLETLFSQ